jgi:hypothetical protein
MKALQQTQIEQRFEIERVTKTIRDQAETTISKAEAEAREKVLQAEIAEWKKKIDDCLQEKCITEAEYRQMTR